MLVTELCQNGSDEIQDSRLFFLIEIANRTFTIFTIKLDGLVKDVTPSNPICTYHPCASYPARCGEVLFDTAGIVIVYTAGSM